MEQLMQKCLISACLAGLCTRYDGMSKLSTPCMEHVKTMFWIPVCPEQLGGLPTPRPAATLSGGSGFDVLAGRAKVIDNLGQDVTTNFIRGAEMVVTIARQHNVQTCFLKARSPSCGVTGPVGVTAALLKNHGIETIEFP